jgi:hypothetical protein
MDKDHCPPLLPSPFRGGGGGTALPGCQHLPGGGVAGLANALTPAPDTSLTPSRASGGAMPVHPQGETSVVCTVPMLHWRRLPGWNGGPGWRKKWEKGRGAGGGGRGDPLFCYPSALPLNLLHAVVCWVGRSWTRRAVRFWIGRRGGAAPRAVFLPFRKGWAQGVLGRAGSAHQELAWSRAGSGFSIAGLGSGLRQHARAG